MKNELLKSPERITSSPFENHESLNGLSRQETEEIYFSRKNSLEKIRGIVCLKFYNEIAEKLELEKQAFEKLLNRQDAKELALANYSFILNPYFFEQKFLNPEEA